MSAARDRDDECRGELLARDGSGRLAHHLGPALRAHLDGCASCRAAREVVADFDDGGAVALDDGARIERLAAAARAWAGARRSRPRAGTHGRGTRRALAFAASVVLACGTASAAVWLWRQPPRGRAADGAGPPRAVALARPAARAAVTGVAAVAGAAAEAAAEPTAARALEPSRALEPVRAPSPARAAVARRARPSARAGGEAAAPAALLREASDARRAGDVARATALYRRLQAEFAGSPEAVLSAVPLGGLLLDAGAPRAALAQFDGYLGGARGGALAPEALYGRGRALARLGARDDERLTWQRLLAEFPDSAYASHARRRLAELR